jgi:hypothetical protein
VKIVTGLLMAIEKLRRLQATNPDGRYGIAVNASGFYRVVDAEDETTQRIDINTLLTNLTQTAPADSFEDY